MLVGQPRRNDRAGIPPVSEGLKGELILACDDPGLWKVEGEDLLLAPVVNRQLQACVRISHVVEGSHTGH